MNDIAMETLSPVNQLMDFDPVASAERILAEAQAPNLGATALNSVDAAFMDAMYQLNTAFATLSADDLQDGQYNAQQQTALASIASVNPMDAFANRATADADAESTDRMHRFLIDKED